jgi:hypothetical protein
MPLSEEDSLWRNNLLRVYYPNRLSTSFQQSASGPQITHKVGLARDDRAGDSI